jgi:arylsulfatase
LTDGKIKYIWFFCTGKEQLFDLSVDPGETKNLSESAAYGEILTKMRRRMVDHLRERGEGFVKDGKLVIRNETLLYSPNYPGNTYFNNG